MGSRDAPTPSQVGARCAALFAERLAPLGLTPRAYGVLSQLAVGDRQTQQQLADRLAIHRNNMVAIIDELERDGWVERRRSTQDRRAFEIHLTPRGSAVVSDVLRAVGQLEAEVAAGLSRSEHRAVLGHLEALANRLGLSRGVHPSVRTQHG